MIHRGFWLTAGAVTGIYGYRRVCAIGRRLSASLAPGAGLTPGAGLAPGTGLSPGASLAPGTGLRDGSTRAAGPRPGLTFGARSARARRSAVVLAREAYRFTRDVREGMELYRLGHSAPAGPTLSAGRSERPARRAPDHDVQPEDGH